jgi:hypothetical protein
MRHRLARLDRKLARKQNALQIDCGLAGRPISRPQRASLRPSVQPSGSPTSGRRTAS